MKQELVAFAESLGFDLCRIAQAQAPPHAPEFRAWLDRGNAGEMAWLERTRERRSDPQNVLPGIKSIIVLGVNYWQGEEAEKFQVSRSRFQVEHAPVLADSNLEPETANLKPAAGRIARYAWGDDYHDVIARKMGLLDEWLITRGGQQKTYVDTGPVLERDLAAAAGAGWHGKSTMLIHPRLGTWSFLAEIFTTLQFEPDAPIPDRCGSCTRCLAACPTGAITAPHQLDARRCISYLTIELKGSIPEELRPLIGDRIYGCDECLTACPWNRFAQASRESAFAARPFVHDMALRDFLSLDAEAFRVLFRNSPIKRTKRRGFLRNVCVALGNIGTRDDLAALEKAAHDPEPLIAEHAEWAIAQIRKRDSGLGPSEIP